VQSYEWYNPSMNLFTKIDKASESAALTAVGHAGVPLYGGRYLGVVAGSMLDTGNAGKLNKDHGMKFYMFREEKMQEQTYIELKVRAPTPPSPARARATSSSAASPPSTPPSGGTCSGRPLHRTDILNLKGPTTSRRSSRGRRWTWRAATAAR
jgi:hypothetical protein